MNFFLFVHILGHEQFKIQEYGNKNYHSFNKEFRKDQEFPEKGKSLLHLIAQQRGLHLFGFRSHKHRNHHPHQQND